MDDNNYYKILDINENASPKEIKIAFRRLARKYHPDRNSKVSEDVMKRINIAFENLSDPEKRRIYDKTLKNSKSAIIDDEDKFNESNTNASDSDTRFVNSNEKTEDYYYYDVNTFFGEKELNANTVYNLGEKTNSPILQSQYRIIVEPSLCLAFGSCEVLAPKVFVVEKNRQINPKAIVISETAEDFDTIMDAAKTCPTKAIIIIDRYTGNCVYP
ncbi:MAG TPA: DnaJ domain-containing protein [Candidatus Saccharimonadales bacterium]|nr:DnaJ domain-containing protein [Candidatus Saccharimonadales bacterium]